MAEREPTLPAPTQTPPVDRDSFREAMARLGAAVHIITTDGPAGCCGFTASAVCSVSDAPPTVLVCLNRASEMNKVFKANGVFCVNTLGAGQEQLSDMFAGLSGVAMADRFHSEPFETVATGSPVLTTALVSLDCRISSINEVGTHSVMFGEVQAIHFGEESSGLVYFKRGYHTL